MSMPGEGSPLVEFADTQTVTSGGTDTDIGSMISQFNWDQLGGATRARCHVSLYKQAGTDAQTVTFKVAAGGNNAGDQVVVATFTFSASGKFYGLSADFAIPTGLKKLFCTANVSSGSLSLAHLVMAVEIA